MLKRGDSFYSQTYILSSAANKWFILLDTNMIKKLNTIRQLHITKNIYSIKKLRNSIKNVHVMTLELIHCVASVYASSFCVQLNLYCSG